MNRGRTEGNWKLLTASVKQRWGKLIDHQLDLWAGTRDRSKEVADRKARQREIEPPK